MSWIHHIVLIAAIPESSDFCHKMKSKLNLNATCLVSPVQHTCTTSHFLFSSNSVSYSQLFQLPLHNCTPIEWIKTMLLTCNASTSSLCFSFNIICKQECKQNHFHKLCGWVTRKYAMQLQFMYIKVTWVLNMINREQNLKRWVT